MNDQISDAFDGLVEKLMGWLDAVIKGLPNLMTGNPCIVSCLFYCKIHK